jgi:hypothetical protein
LLATTLRRCDWALMALPETPKIENMDMIVTFARMIRY